MKRSSDAPQSQLGPSDGVAAVQWLHPVPGKEFIVFVAGAPQPSARLALFDLDQTLIDTQSGRAFPTSAQDWRWLNAHVVARLQQAHAEGYRVVIVSNQAGIAREPTTEAWLHAKLSAMAAALAIPLTALLAAAKDEWRKPHTAMVDYFAAHLNAATPVDWTNSYYVGDAAGRPADKASGRKKDHSCADRKLAANLGVKFYTPEEYFEGRAPQPFEWGTVAPQSILDNAPAELYRTTKGTPMIDTSCVEVIIMMGCPASGKSSVTRRLVNHGYVAVNLDTLKTQDKCLKELRVALTRGQSVVVDNTNPDRAARARYVAAVRAAWPHVRLRCFRMTTPREVAQHLNFVREALTQGATTRVPAIAYNTFFKRLEEPTLEEGFADICYINFVPEFTDAEQRRLFLQWSDD